MVDLRTVCTSAQRHLSPQSHQVQSHQPLRIVQHCDFHQIIKGEDSSIGIVVGSYRHKFTPSSGVEECECLYFNPIPYSQKTMQNQDTKKPCNQTKR